MGLATILKKVKAKEREIRLLILGLDNAGKTTILKRLCDEDISTISPTLGFNIKSLQHGAYLLNCWDVGGQTSLRSYWRNYFEATDGLVWVVDSADRPDRLEQCRKELHALLQEERLAGASLLILANKQDVPTALSSEQLATFLHLDDIQGHHWQVMACSAVTGAGCAEGIDWVVDDIASRIYIY
ncbi:hypothetical protein CXG81DRAFT_26415 [Caulochytrium protostelioides]|uniref:ADP-ribosylation factor-like protein 2 n=1 Tax=Caulochytrium protostelioides TaxID=1555241 RepID=A0A4P9WUX0_9FUNG|nr:ARF/SAR superfamily [Caulochytrium protostelioides]RKP00876.1 hypothetical protein CXG81DRAFT_26415 [Caulochytrium protostelioides]|eukprot:RKP00876.1 hypothetical protein CXG81DRAFT_26415 [Caulochytrium protostelioides]